MNQLLVIGHELIKARLARFPGQTLLLTGPEGIGRRPLARWYAAGLNCQTGFPPCGSCPGCLGVFHGDYLELAPQDSDEIKIEPVRQAIHGFLEVRPRFKTRILVIDQAQRLNEAAANALLKVLEEPPAQARIILIAPAREAVFPTLASRAFEERLNPVPESTLAPFCADPEVLAFAAGRPGVMFRLLASETWGKEAEGFLAALNQGGMELVEAALALAKAEPEPWDYLADRLKGLPLSERALVLKALADFRLTLASRVNPELAATRLAWVLRV